MREITSLVNPYVKKINSLYNRKIREQEQKFIIEGYHLITEAKKANVLEEVLIVNEDDEIKGIENIKVTSEIIKKLTKTKNPQNIIGICNFFDYKQEYGSRVLILDNVSDPGNMGTLIRSALGFGFDSIVLSNNSVDVYNDKVIRATQGALFKIPIIRKELIPFIKKLKDNNYHIIGTDLLSTTKLKKIKNNPPLALILGNEANGIEAPILKLTDENVKIEIDDRLESLNVAVAGGIIMYYLRNQK